MEELEKNSDAKIINILPSNYDTKVLSCTSKGEGFIAVVRVAIWTKTEALEWLKTFSENSLCTFKVDRTYGENTQKIVFKKEFRCHRNTRPSSHNVSRHHPKHTGCTAKLTITVKQKDLKRSKDKYLKEFPTEIFIRNVHNHPIMSKDSLRHRPTHDKIKEIFEDYFAKGHTPASALKVHKLKLLQKYAEDYDLKVADGAICPSKRGCYELYYKFKKHCSESANVQTASEEEKNNTVVPETNNTVVLNIKNDDEPDVQPCDLEDVALYLETSSCNDIDKNNTTEITKQIQGFCDSLIVSVQENPDMFSPAVEEFINSYNNLTTESERLNALQSFAKSSNDLIVSKRKYSEILLNTEAMNSDHSYFSEEPDVDISFSKRRNTSQTITLYITN